MVARCPRLVLLLALIFLLPACHSVSVGADNRYGYSRGAATVNVPIDAVADGVKAPVRCPNVNVRKRRNAAPRLRRRRVSGPGLLDQGRPV